MVLWVALIIDPLEWLQFNSKELGYFRLAHLRLIDFCLHVLGSLVCPVVHVAHVILLDGAERLALHRVEHSGVLVSVLPLHHRRLFANRGGLEWVGCVCLFAWRPGVS